MIGCRHLLIHTCKRGPVLTKERVSVNVSRDVISEFSVCTCACASINN